MDKMTLTKVTKGLGILGSIFMLAASIIALYYMVLRIPVTTIIPITYTLVVIVVGLVGSVPILCAVKQISDTVNDKEIFNNLLMWFICLFIAIFIFFTAISVFLSNLEMPPFKSLFDIDKSLFDIFAGQGMRDFGIIFAALWPIIAGLISVWIVLIVAASFLKRGYERIAARTRTEMFGVVGYWYYRGAQLAIIFAGFIIIMIALILQIMAFLFLPESIPSRPTERRPSGA
jgi:uncharacterized membrane protein